MREVLAFEHPLAGFQIAKGTIEPGERPEDAACRELEEESGLQSTVAGTIGAVMIDGLMWHFFEMEVISDIPDRFSFLTEDDGGHWFEYFWHPIDEEPSDQWHPVFFEVLAYLAHWNR